MSLKVWLPLNGTLENRGISQVTINNTGSVLADGKTGSCYSYSTTTYTHINGNTIAGLNKFTVCCWVYLTNASTYTVFTSEDDAGYWQFVFSSNYLRVRDTVSGVTGSRTDKSLTAMPVSTWTHVAFVYDNGVVSHYRNGELIETLTFHQGASMNAHNRLYIGADALNSSYQGNCRVNDFRVYDYCLSAKEIKDISNGLILHYKMDEHAHLMSRCSNITWNQVFMISNWTKTVPYTVNGVTMVRTGNDIVFSGKATSEINITNVFWWKGEVQGHKFIVRRKLKDKVTFANNLYGGITLNSYTIQNGANPNPSYPDGQVVYVRIPSGTDFGDGESVSINLFDLTLMFGSGNEPTLEEFNKMFPYEYYQYDEGTVVDLTELCPDSSGYRNYGTINGITSLDSDSPRYESCAVFDGNDFIIVPQSVKVKDEISIGMWAYMSNWGNYNSRLISCTEAGGWNFEPASGKLNFVMGTGTSSNTYKSATSTTTLAQLGSGWHHFMGTYDGLKTKLYIDGVLDATNDAYTTKTPIYYNASNGVFIGAEAQTSATVPATSPVKFSGKMSDVRIYATALSAEDIMDLYNAPEYIDDLGTMGGYEFVENSTDGQEIGKNGVVGVKNFIEYSDNLKLMPDGSVFLKLLRHNNPASKLFTENNNWLNTSDPDLYSSLIQLKNVDWMRNLAEYEFLACEKLTSSDTESQIRWKQTSNPALTSTATGYELISGSPRASAALMNKGTYGAMHNGSSWWCCCGSYTAYQGGIPGFTNVVTTGYMELYIRIPDEMIKGYVDGDAKFFKQSINARQFKEI